MVVVFGSVNLDLVARVDRLPHRGETLAGQAFDALPGGKGANQALAARRAGADVVLHAAVGDDAFAAPALALLRRDGVDLSGVRTVEAPTGIAVIHVDSAGENAITVVAGANAAASADRLPDALLTPAATVVMQLEVPLAAVVSLARRARARGARVVLNASPAAGLPDDLATALDVLVVNEHEAAVLAAAAGLAAPPAQFAVEWSRRFGDAAVVTLGGAGLVAARPGEIHTLHAPAVDVVDTVGAGDALVGALAAALDRRVPWPRALREGLAAGSLACTGRGAQASLPAASTIAALANTI